MIISVDHGNKSVKTPHRLFTSGIISMPEYADRHHFLGW